MVLIQINIGPTVLYNLYNSPTTVALLAMVGNINNIVLGLYMWPG